MNERQNQTESKGPARGPRPSQPSSEEVKSPEGREAGIPETPAALSGEPEELPNFQDETRVVLLPVNPYLVHVYWGVHPDDQEKTEKVFARPVPHAQPVLRFYDVTFIDFDGTNAHSWFDIEVDLRAENWYVPLQSPSKSYCIDLGLRIGGGEFQRLARSNVAETARAWPSDNLEERYLLVERECPRDKTGAPPVEPAGVRETPSKRPEIGEWSLAEEQKPETNRLSIAPQAEMGTLPLEPAEVVEAPPDTRQMGELYRAEEKKPEPKELGIFRAAPPGEIERRLKEFYQRRMEDWSSVAPNAEPARNDLPAGEPRANLTGPSERGFHTGSLGRPPTGVLEDLTALSERSFRAGASSGGKPRDVSSPPSVKAVSEER